LRLGAWIMLPLLLGTLVVRPGLAALFEHRAAVERERALLGRELRLVAESPRDRQLLRSAERALGTAGPRLFAGAEPVSASAELARYVAREAKASGLTVEQTETETVLDAANGSPSPDGGTSASVENTGGGRPLRVAIRAQGDVVAITAFLSAIEHGSKLVRVEQIAIAAGDSTSDDGSLSLSATLSGFARRDFLPGDASPAVPASPVHGRLVSRTEP
jgi:hypothetical protein